MAGYLCVGTHRACAHNIGIMLSRESNQSNVYVLVTVLAR